MKNTLRKLLAAMLIIAMTAGLVPSYAAQEITVTVSVETRTVNGEDLIVPCKVKALQGSSAEKILLDLCKEKNIAVDNSYGYISTIGGYGNDGVKYHAWSGWIYWLNGEMGMVGPADCIPEDGDEIRWRYSVSGDMYGNDVIFADDYRELRAQIAAADAIENYDGYSDKEQENLFNAYANATEKLLEIDTYPSENGKAGGLPGFILAKNVTQWSGDGKEVRDLAKKLGFAIDKKEYVTAQSVSLNRTSITLSKGDSIKLEATIIPENATDKAIVWSTMNLMGEESAEVTVSQDGMVTANDVTNFAFVQARHGEVLSPATCTVKVIDPPDDSALTELSAEGGKLIPGFHPKVYSYRIEVGEETESITVKATAPGSKITINGESATRLSVPLNMGENIISVISQVIGKPEMTYKIRAVRGDISRQIGEIADNISKSYEYTSDGWRILDKVFHLGRESAKINRTKYIETVKNAISTESVSLGTLATHVLVLTAMGEDPTAFETENGTVNLVERLATHSGYKYGDTLDAYSTATALYAMLPYTPESEDAWTKERMAEALSDAQYADGSWGFDGVTGDVDVTAMVVTALAPFADSEEIKKVNERAIEYLSSIQQENGGYSSWGSNNANSAEMVLIALCASGIDAAEDPRFIKNGHNLLDALLSFVTEDKNGLGFVDTSYNSYATEQGLRAFATYAKFASEKESISPYIFTGMSGKAADGAEGDANLVSLVAEGINLSPAFDPAITEYSLTTDAAQITVNAMADTANVQVSDTDLSFGKNEIKVTVTAQNGNTKVYTINATRTGGESSQEKKTVSVAISGYNGTEILRAKTVTLKNGDTPYSVLKRVADSEGIAIETKGSDSSVYVVSIDGVAELDYGAESGWMYSVNGEYIQESAGTYKLSDGDVLVWAYTSSLGTDIGGGSFGSYYSKPETDKESISENTDISAIIDIISKKKELSVWEAYALAICDRNVPQEFVTKIQNEVLGNKGNFRKITDLASTILVAGALGYNAENFAGINLINALTNSSRMENQGVNGPVFALIALDSMDYQVKEGVWTREKLVDAILAAQNADGGIALVRGETSNVDITAMALTALGKYPQEKVAAAKKKMLEYLSKSQKSSGGFALYDKENCESAAQVIIALSSEGISLDDTRFVKGENTVADAMQSYRLTDGTYCHELSGGSNSIATEQAILALIAMEQKKSIYTLTPKTFRDEAEISDWAYDAVMSAYSREVIVGDNGLFAPKRTLTRAELAQILARALKLSADNNIEYSDVSENSWYCDAVNAIGQSGLMLGAHGKFRPNERITREELAVVISRVCNLKSDIEIPGIEQVSFWARDGVCAVYEAKIMQGDANGFNPRANVTREMAAVVCIRALDLIK